MTSVTRSDDVHELNGRLVKACIHLHIENRNLKNHVAYLLDTIYHLESSAAKARLPALGFVSDAIDLHCGPFADPLYDELCDAASDFNFKGIVTAQVLQDDLDRVPVISVDDAREYIDLISKS